VKSYYARSASEYDATSWHALDPGPREAVERFVASLPAVRTLDTAAAPLQLSAALA